MSRIIADRMTTSRDKGIVVFLIGMRVNRWWKIHKWLPTALAMPRMLRELKARPDSGYLGGLQLLGTSVQYWDSVDALLAYAADRTGQHYPAWADFYRRVGTGSDVGIWHETYAVPPGAFETMYVNMPAFGLGRVAPLVPARGQRARARARLGGQAPAAAQDVSVTAAG